MTNGFPQNDSNQYKMELSRSILINCQNWYKINLVNT